MLPSLFSCLHLSFLLRPEEQEQVTQGENQTHIKRAEWTDTVTQGARTLATEGRN